MELLRRLLGQAVTAIRECYVGDRTCNGLVADDGTVVALIADEKLTKLLGRNPRKLRTRTHANCYGFLVEEVSTPASRARFSPDRWRLVATPTQSDLGRTTRSTTWPTAHTS